MTTYMPDQQWRQQRGDFGRSAPMGGIDMPEPPSFGTNMGTMNGFPGGGGRGPQFPMGGNRIPSQMPAGRPMPEPMNPGMSLGDMSGFPPQGGGPQFPGGGAQLPGMEMTPQQQLQQAFAQIQLTGNRRADRRNMRDVFRNARQDVRGMGLGRQDRRALMNELRAMRNSYRRNNRMGRPQRDYSMAGMQF